MTFIRARFDKIVAINRAHGFDDTRISLMALGLYLSEVWSWRVHVPVLLRILIFIHLYVNLVVGVLRVLICYIIFVCVLVQWLIHMLVVLNQLFDWLDKLELLIKQILL